MLECCGGESARWHFAISSLFSPTAANLRCYAYQNMGIGFVLLFWAVIGTILSGLAAIVFGGFAAVFTRRVIKGRRPAILAATLLPFACFAWAGVIFAFQSLVNEGLLHRDPGLGDAWSCPLPNGYQILMIDVTDYGWVYNPKTQFGYDGVGEREDAVFGVRLVQIAGPYIFGGVDEDSPPELDSAKIDSYFMLDARTGKRTKLPNYDALSSAAGQLGIQLHLEPIDRVYRKYRFSWFDVFAGVLFCVPILIAFFFLVRWVLRLRRTRGPALQPA